LDQGHPLWNYNGMIVDLIATEYHANCTDGAFLP